MKYGLMYYKETDNIGDDIQTYVAMKYLPHIDYYIDREDLSCFVPNKKEYVSVIMNGWYIHNKIAWPPSPYINPLLISMHFKSQNDTDVGETYLQGFGGDFLKKNGPVGARDEETKNRLEKNGINSYLSGCMTLTLDKFENVHKKNKICLVDVETSIIEKISKNTEYDIEVLTHYLNKEETRKRDFATRMCNVENLLKKYQESHLVITSRLHVALPCIALGTPVILLHNRFFDKDRLETFFKYMDNYEVNEFLNMDIKQIIKNPKENNKEFIKIKNDLDKKCKIFIQLCEKNNLEIKKLPDTDKYKEYTKKINWYKQIYEKERLALENIENKRSEEFKIYHDNLEKMNIEKAKLINLNALLKEELNNSKKELSKIYNSKGWKYLKCFRKVFGNE